MMRYVGIMLLIVFYAFYIGKMLLQRRKGIRTDQMARGKQKGPMFYTELIMKAATYTVVLAEVISIVLIDPPVTARTVLGAAFGVAGDVVFAFAIVTMRDSWRAGIPTGDQTALVTRGIYAFSRNPAFLAFDCVYAGIVLMFFNIPLLLFSLLAMVMLHLQILQEEHYLAQTFGEDYAAYRSAVGRYIGRKGGCRST